MSGKTRIGWATFGARIMKPSNSFVGDCFDKLGQYIGLHPYPFLVVPALLTVVLATGVLFAHTMDDPRLLYAPTNAASRLEYEIHQEFTGEDINSSYCALVIEATNPSHNLLLPAATDLIININNFVLKNLTFSLNGHEYHFGRDICPRISFCPNSNQVLEKFFEIYWNRRLEDSVQVRLNWPIMKIYGNKFFLPAYLYGVKLDEGTSRASEIQIVHMTFPIPGTDVDNADAVARVFEKTLAEYLRTHPPTDLHASLFSLRILKDELTKNTYYTLPFISVTVVLLTSFTVCS